MREHQGRKRRQRTEVWTQNRQTSWSATAETDGVKLCVVFWCERKLFVFYFLKLMAICTGGSSRVGIAPSSRLSSGPPAPGSASARSRPLPLPQRGGGALYPATETTASFPRSAQAGKKIGTNVNPVIWICKMKHVNECKTKILRRKHCENQKETQFVLAVMQQEIFKQQLFL